MLQEIQVYGSRQQAHFGGTAALTKQPAEKKNKPAKTDDFEGWAPTPAEMKLRRAKSKQERQFWEDWDKERRASIEELRDAFMLRCGGSDVMAFDIGRIPHTASARMSHHDRGVYRRFKAWVEDMKNASYRKYLPMIQGVVQHGEGCGDRGLFREAIDFHVAICRHEIRRGLLTRRDEKE